MNTHPFKRTHAPTLLCGVLVVLVALGGCAPQAPAQPATQPPAATVTKVAEPQPTAVPAQKVVEPQPTAVPAQVLTFWTSDDLSGSDKTAVQKQLDAFMNDTENKVTWNLMPDVYKALADGKADDKGPDLAAFPLPVPEQVGVGQPWLLCNSRLAVLKESKHSEAAAKLLEYLTSEPVCYGGLPITFVPYATPPPPPKEIIGQAEYVPGDPVIVEGVVALKDQLIAANATINVARSVVLTYAGETTYMAPVGIPLTQGSTNGQQFTVQAMKDGITIAMVVVKPGVRDLNLPEGAYLVRDFFEGGSETWTVSFIDASGESVAEVKGVKGEKPSFDTAILAELPSAGIDPGSKKCRSCKCTEHVGSTCVEWTCQTFTC